MQTLSICAIYKNEEDKIVRYLRHLKGLSDEIILVDTGSDKLDLTGKIAQVIYPDIKLFYHEFKDDFSEVRNYAISKATKDWILILDLDEIILQKDHKLLREIIDTETSADLIIFPRRHWLNLGMTKELKAPYPDHHLRLFKNGKGIFYINKIHESIAGYTQKRVVTEIEIQHFNPCYDSGPEFVAKSLLYRRLEKELKEEREQKAKENK